jgi:uncharacterized protein (UPF0218 family)
MMIAQHMKVRALSEFDRLAAEKEAETRHQLAAAGASLFEIEAYIEACRMSLAEQRAAVGTLVTVELMKAGVPLDGEIHERR